MTANTSKSTLTRPNTLLKIASTMRKAPISSAVTSTGRVLRRCCRVAKVSGSRKWAWNGRIKSDAASLAQKLDACDHRVEQRGVLRHRRVRRLEQHIELA